MFCGFGCIDGNDFASKTGSGYARKEEVITVAGDTKKRIAEIALELFSKNGYPGTSMSDIAKQLGITKTALYKHYTSKHEILECIVERMKKTDYVRAEEYDMPESEPDGFADDYMNTSAEKIREYSIAQFRYWTEEEFPSKFRKMLTVEQYRDDEMARLYHNYISTGPTEYMAAVFRRMTDSDGAAMQLALDFYGPMYLLYSIYDGAEDKESVYELLNTHIDRFISKMK